MRTCAVLGVSVVAILSSGPLRAQGQGIEPIITDRPDRTEGARTVGSYMEWFADLPTEPRGSTEHYADAGLTFSPGPDLQYDIGVGTGLTRASDDSLIGIRDAWRW